MDGIGAILAMPMTMMLLIIMENFEGTRPLALLMRYTSDEKKEERQQAQLHLKNLWNKIKTPFDSHRGSNDDVE